MNLKSVLGYLNLEYCIFKTNTFETKILKNNKILNIFKHQVKKKVCGFYLFYIKREDNWKHLK